MEKQVLTPLQGKHNPLSKIACIADDLIADSADAQTVINVAMETYAEDHPEFMGVLDLLGRKLDEISSAGSAIATLAPYQPPVKRPLRRRKLCVAQSSVQ